MIESESFFTTFIFEGFKNTAPITCHSSRALIYLRGLEWNSNVKSYFQPLIEIKIEYRHFIYSASIDFWIEDKENRISLVHLVDAEIMQLYENQPVLKSSIEDHCQLMQVNYLTVEPPKPWHSIQIKNLHFLWAFARIEIKTSHCLLTGLFFTEQKTPTLGKLKSCLKEHGFEIEIAYSMIFHKVVLVDINFATLTDNAPVQSNPEVLQNIEVGLYKNKIRTK